MELHQWHLPSAGFWRVVLAALAAALVPLVAGAHCVVGARFFPATLSVDDPCVAEELSLPTVASFKNGDDPSAREVDIAAEYSKRLTNTVGVSIGSAWTRISPPGEPSVTGSQNLEASLKWQFLTQPAREFVTSAALEVEFGHTGNATVGAESFTVYTPTLFIGQGFGGLPEDMRMARPFAVTGTEYARMVIVLAVDSGAALCESPKSCARDHMREPKP